MARKDMGRIRSEYKVFLLMADAELHAQTQKNFGPNRDPHVGITSVFTFSNDACLSLDEKLRAALVNTNIQPRFRMRLLNVHTLELGEIFEIEVRRYSVLSHRWGNNVLFYKQYRKVQIFQDQDIKRLLTFACSYGVVQSNRDSTSLTKVRSIGFG